MGRHAHHDVQWRLMCPHREGLRGVEPEVMKLLGNHGQALAEFALVFPIFAILVFGVIEMARFVYTDTTLSQAAREGVRLASVEARWIGDSGLSCVDSPADITAANP